MANQVTVLSATGITSPFSATTCDFYGNNCSYVGTGNTFPVTFTLPSQFNTAPVIQLTLIDSVGCTISELIYCTTEGQQKQFQNMEYFFFMSGEQYYFQ